jgi:hypothetical protein
MKTQQVFKNSKSVYDVAVLLLVRPTGMISLFNNIKIKRIPKRRKFVVIILSLDSLMCHLCPTFYRIKNRGHMPKI